MTIKGWPDSRRPVDPIGGWGPGHPGVGNVSGLPNIARRLDRAHPINVGLCGWWPMDEMQGTRIRDLSIYGNHGTLTNAANPATATSGWGAGVSQRELAFDATDDYIAIPHSTSLAITGAITMLGWLNVDYASNYLMLFTKVSGTVPAPYQAYIQAGTGLIELWRGNGVSQVNRVGTNPIPSQTECMFAMTHDLTTGKHYLNGAANGSGALSVSISDAGTALNVGQRASAYWLKGRAWHLRIYNRALSATEIAQLYADKWLGSIGGIT